jgi:cytochrome b involved in lipid metabolism
MKKEIIFGLIGSIIIILMILAFANSYNKQQAVSNTTNIKNSDTKLTMTEINKHTSAADCWIIINNKVYTTTSYLNAHPGGASIIVPLCGKDATDAFATKAGRGQHSQTAYSQLQSLYIGNVGGSLTTEPNSITPPTGGGEDD